jgi:threonine dehydrogenase-like Zn-dependent dehydrogenase
MGLESGYSAGYSYEYFGGDATYCIIPKIAIDLGCVLPLNGTYFANASLSEPMSCIIGAFHASYHTKQYVYKYDMGIKEGGKVALLGCAGPMGLGAIEYAINGSIKPKLVVVVDIDEERLNRAASLIKVEEAREKGIQLIYLNTKNVDAVSELIKLSGGKGYDDVFVFAAVKQLIETADDILGNDGCLNFFAGPTDNNFKAPFNFYKVHYEGTHIVGTSGGSTGDMLESIELSDKGLINPSFMITHVGGLNAVPDTVRNLPNIPGGKKLIYPHIQMELTAIEDFERLGENSEFYRKLAEICKKNNNVWCEEAEKFLLESLENK